MNTQLSTSECITDSKIGPSLPVELSNARLLSWFKTYPAPPPNSFDQF